eukprot:m.16265 g.16265  ORF g.16265 m.16265 type:complete len:442 (-) comp5648_c0_seq1:73-1398(-)
MSASAQLPPLVLKRGSSTGMPESSLRSPDSSTPSHHGRRSSQSNVQKSRKSTSSIRYANLSRKVHPDSAITDGVSLPSCMEPSSINNTKLHNASLDLLVSGHIEAFIEMFNLVHKDPDGNGLEDDSEKLALMQVGLGRRDAAMLEDSPTKAFDSVSNLADYFEKSNDINLAKHFRQSALDMSNTLGVGYQCRANEATGLTLEHTGNLEESQQCFENMRELAIGQSIPEQVETSCVHLVRVLVKQVDKLEEKKQMEEALQLLMTAENYAKESKKEDVLTLCQFRLGKACESVGHVKKGIEYLETYMQAAKKDDEEGQNQACILLANCHAMLGDTDIACGYMERLVETSLRTEQYELTSQACARLGEICGNAGQLEKSVEWLTKAYDYAKDYCELEWATQCQVDLATARTRIMVLKYTKTVASAKPADVMRIVEWKSSRNDTL